MLLAVNTTLILSLIRSHFVDEGIQAYLIPNGGAQHDGRLWMSSLCEERIVGVSGFSGIGSVLVTKDAALLWTDPTFYEEAEKTLDENWTLMKLSEPEVPDENEYLSQNFPSGSVVGVDAKTYSISQWEARSGALASSGITLKTTSQNLVDAEWKEKPICSGETIVEYPVQFAGKSVQDKLLQLRNALTAKGVDVVLVSELDEVAWLFNLRGSDFGPAFYSFGIVSNDQAVILVKPSTIDETLKLKLKEAGVTVVEEYDEAEASIFNSFVKGSKKVWLSKFVNAGMALVVPPEKQLIKLGPVALLEAVKNPTEVQGLRNAHLRDSLAFVSFFSWLEDEIDKGNKEVTELTASAKVNEFQSKGEHHVMSGYESISAYGANSAQPLYRPTPETNKVISTDAVYLLDAGSHYLDGTTDITRTIHLGMPRDIEKDRFTRILKGHIALSTKVFPNKSTGDRLDSFARQFLWQDGVDYSYFLTGHSISPYMYLHYGPHQITTTFNPDDSGIEENMFISNEPGYFKDGEFGIRIENIMRMVKAKFDGYLEIELISFVPFQLKMIKAELMTSEEIAWLDSYHKECREKLMELIDNVDYVDPSVRLWLIEATKSFAEFNSRKSNQKLQLIHKFIHSR